MAILRTEFPEISISKIRFLEAEGLITPQRAPSGYRRYTESDVERLRYVLSVQREHYLPLKVIREHLEQIDRGQAPLGLSAQGARSAADPQPGRLRARRPQLRNSRSGSPVKSCWTPAVSPRARSASWNAPRSCTPDEEPPTTAGTPSRWRSPPADWPSTASTGDICGRSSCRPTAKSGWSSKRSRRTSGAPASNRDVPGDVTQLVISFHAALVRTAMERNVCAMPRRCRRGVIL